MNNQDLLKEYDRRIELLQMARNLVLMVENEDAEVEPVSSRRSPEVRKKMALVQSKRWKDKKTATAATVSVASKGKPAAAAKVKAKQRPR